MTIVKMKFGSHLYGTATKDSDTDIKGVALPTWRQVALGKIPKHIEYSSTGSESSKNTSNDTDTEVFCLHEFVKLALEGQTVALDMLHAPAEMLLSTSDLWAEIVSHRSKFYTKNMTAFVGYARKQAAKYGVKGSRLHAAKAVIDWLNSAPADARISDVAGYEQTFPTGEHCTYEISKGGIPQFNVCGKGLQVTSRVGYCKEVVQNYYDKYGERARAAARDEGVDWKAVSHALRAAYQVKELLQSNTITFPRPEATHLVAVKTGQLRYAQVAEELDNIIDEVTAISATSQLPEAPDRVFWEGFLLHTVRTKLVP